MIPMILMIINIIVLITNDRWRAREAAADARKPAPPGILKANDNNDNNNNMTNISMIMIIMIIIMIICVY